jgi:hypothetical protein
MKPEGVYQFGKAVGRAHLTATDAKAKGYTLVARKAALARG